MSSWTRNALRLFAGLVMSMVSGQSLGAAPSASVQGQEVVVTAREYRVRFKRFACDFEIELRGPRGKWRRVMKKRTRAEFALVHKGHVRTSAGAPAECRHVLSADRVVVGMTTSFSAPSPALAKTHFICTDDGILVHFMLLGERAAQATVCWAMPRLLLDEALFDSYAFWRGTDELRSDRIASLGHRDVYAGVSPWGQAGDTARGLSPRHPAVIARAENAGIALGVVFVQYDTDWPGSFSFIQKHTPSHLYLYAAHANPQAAAKGLWAWLAPFPADDLPVSAAKVERLLTAAERLTREFRPIAPEPDPDWSRPVPDFPRALRRARPVEDIRNAVVYTVNECVHSDYGVTLARKVGSDVLVRAWFKWHNAREYAKYARLVPQAHALGALFGGGITCSALYHRENNLTEEQVLDMATRGPDGQLVDAWGEPDTRHGTLSNPAYRQYLLSWCRRQIDAGVDYLFMDEHTAALQANEGFDDYSIRDFRAFLIQRYCTEKQWKRDDERWQSALKIDLRDHTVCADGTMDSFNYRAYFKTHGLVAKPHSGDNPLVGDWHAFRHERDDRAWKWLTQAIRAYAASKGRRVLISANGLARYVDLQVLGVWGRWRAKDGSVDLSQSQIQEWASLVAFGRSLAGDCVPVVFFHDWGFGGFPWMEVSPGSRKLWMRVRGAEIYAAGGFFAFPIQGPYANDALRDGTIHEVARQTAFYQRHKALYLDAELVGFEPIDTGEPMLSLALWRRSNPPGLILHVINRQSKAGKSIRRGNVAVKLPIEKRPKAVRVVSPDWDGEKKGHARSDGRSLTLVLQELDAYAVALLEYDELPRIALRGRRIVPRRRWARPGRNEFVVAEGGLVREQWALNGFLQGKLHTHLRNPPTFLIHLPRGGALHVHVQAVATLGAKLECLIDGRPTEAVELPDRDRKNDGLAPEYDETYEFAIPPGVHRVTVHNVGGDWATIGWYAFAGQVDDPKRKP